MQGDAIEVFSDHLREASAVITAQPQDWANADDHVMQAAAIAVEGRWTADTIWRTYQASGTSISREKLIFALAKLRLEANASRGDREITDRMLFAFEDAERIDMLLVSETAFAPEHLPTH